MAGIGKNQSRDCQLRVALIGCGEHSAENLVPSLSEIGSVAVVVVTDPEPGAAAFAAKRLHGAAIEPDWSTCLARNDIDAVVVAAPPQIHANVAAAGIRRNLHVFVEKPPTSTLGELKSLADEADQRRLVTCVGHNLRHADVAMEMRAFLDDSERSSSEGIVGFGKPIGMEMRYYASKPRGDRWNLNSPLRSFLLSHANHAIDFMVFQMGPILRVNAAIAEGGTDGVVLAVQLRFKSGAVGTLMATSLAPHFTIAGSIMTDTGGIIALDSLHHLTVYGVGEDRKRWGRQWTTKSLLTGYRAAGYATELEQFANAVLSGDPSRCHPSFADELAVYDAIDEIERLIVAAQ